MMDEVEIYCTAKKLVDTYGKDAALAAANRANFYSEQKCRQNEKNWKRIMQAVHDLMVPTPQKVIH
ncbi:MAG: hypothetical protein JKY60_09165 [Kordiimonadaceae bacterium]|nr:hypothetical protein [Kordiimonadaceae bacterium]